MFLLASLANAREKMAHWLQAWLAAACFYCSRTAIGSSRPTLTVPQRLTLLATTHSNNEPR